MHRNPNVEWTMDIGPISPQAIAKAKAKAKKDKKPPPKIASKLDIIAEVNLALVNITKVCKGARVEFHPRLDAMKVVKRDGTNVLRMRFSVDRPILITRLEHLSAGFRRLPPQHDYRD